MTGESAKSLAALPAVYEILAHPRLAALAAKIDHALFVAEIQARLARHREALRAGGGTPPDADAVAAEVAKIVEGWFEPRVKSVINLTGTLLHTNLGRAPLSDAAVAAMAAASGTVNLEYSLQPLFTTMPPRCISR